MDGRIGYLHCDYCIRGSTTPAGLLAARLAGVAREQVPASYAAALDEALEDAPAVYVLREVDCDIGLLVDAHVTDAELARRWGERMAGAVMQCIAEGSAATIRRGPQSGATAPARLVRFDDQADFVAHFLADTARGTARDVWFYGAFAAFQGRDIPEITRRVLGENLPYLPAILGKLQQLGALHTLLAALDMETQGWLWSQLRGEPGAEREAFRSLLAVAVQLADRLGIWKGPVAGVEGLLPAYVATGPPWPDWRDRRGLAAALLAILSFLSGRGHLHLTWPAAQDQAAHGLGPPPRTDPQVGQITFSYLWVAMLRFVDEFELWAAPPDRDALRRAYLAAHAPPALREPGDVRAAALDILSYLAGHGSLRRSAADAGPHDLDRAWASTDGGWRESFEAWWQAHDVEVAESLAQQARGAATGQVAPDWEQSAGRCGVTGRVMGREQAGPDTGLPLSREDRIAALLGPAFLDRMHGALVSLDWLDTTWLEEGLVKILVEIRPPRAGESQPARGGLPGTAVTPSLPPAPGGSRPAGPEVRSGLAPPAGSLGYGPTLRQRDLLEALQAILTVGLPGLDRRDLAAPANALRLYAALLERCHVWASDVVAVEMIERLLLASARIKRCRSPAEVLRRLGMGDLVQVSRLLFEGDAVGGMHAPPQGEAGEASRLLREGNATRIARPYMGNEAGAGVRDGMAAWQPAAGSNALDAVRFVAGLGRPGLAVLQTLVGPTGQSTGCDEAGIESACAGVALLFRAVLDAQLPALASRLQYPTPEDTRFQALLLALCLRWAGNSALESGRIDEGLLALVGLETEGALDEATVQGWSTVARLAGAWAAASAADHLRFQTAWLRTQVAHRMLAGSAVHLYRLLLDDGSSALIAGEPTSGCWSLGKILSPDEQPADVLPWLDVWQEATGQEPVFAVTTDDFGTDLTGLHSLLFLDPGAGDALALENAADRKQLETALGRFESGRLGLPQADLTVALAAAGLMRLWARWLRGFSSSSIPYLLSNFIRRPGCVWIDREEAVVELEPRPLDMVLRMAGYLEPLPRVPWLGGRTVRFQS